MSAYRTTASVLRLRSSPGTDHRIIGRLPHGTTLEALQGPVDGWLRVKARLLDGELTGWVSADHVEPLDPVQVLVEPP